MDLSIIIVSWKVKDKLKANLQALYASKGVFSCEVFVVDNNSNDGTVEMVKNNFPQVKLIANKENLGFAKANNQALKKAKGDYLLLLNPDMLVNSDTLINSLTWARNNQQAAVASCELVTLQGQTIKHVRRFPTLFDQLMIILKVPHLFPGVLNNYLQAKFDYNQEAKVDSVRGAFFMINRHVWEELSRQKFPRLDEQYFIWFEEVDFCRQVYALGGEVWYFPEATCVDYVGASFNQIKVNIKQRYFEESMLKYFKKWQSPWQYYILKTAWPLGRFLANIFSK